MLAVELVGGAVVVVAEELGAVDGDVGVGLGEVDDELTRSAELALKRIEVAIVEKLAVVDNHDTLAEHLDIFHIVGGEDDTGLAFLVDMFDEGADPFFGDDIETDGGFIEEEDVGVVEEGGAEVGTHALAEGEGADGGIEEGGEFE